MKHCDKNSGKNGLCYANSHDIVACSTAIVSLLTREMSNAELRILTRLLSNVLRSLEAVLEIEFIQETECRKESPLNEIAADVQKGMNAIDDG